MANIILFNQLTEKISEENNNRMPQRQRDRDREKTSAVCVRMNASVWVKGFILESW